jgi:hypothetical protein
MARSMKIDQLIQKLSGLWEHINERTNKRTKRQASFARVFLSSRCEETCYFSFRTLGKKFVSIIGPTAAVSCGDANSVTINERICNA